jgi:hypothetical protein
MIKAKVMKITTIFILTVFIISNIAFCKSNERKDEYIYNKNIEIKISHYSNAKISKVFQENNNNDEYVFNSSRNNEICLDFTIPVYVNSISINSRAISDKAKYLRFDFYGENDSGSIHFTEYIQLAKEKNTKEIKIKNLLSVLRTKMIMINAIEKKEYNHGYDGLEVGLYNIKLLLTDSMQYKPKNNFSKIFYFYKNVKCYEIPDEILSDMVYFSLIGNKNVEKMLYNLKCEEGNDVSKSEYIGGILLWYEKSKEVNDKKNNKK